MFFFPKKEVVCAFLIASFTLFSVPPESAKALDRRYLAPAAAVGTVFGAKMYQDYQEDLATKKERRAQQKVERLRIQQQQMAEQQRLAAQMAEAQRRQQMEKAAFFCDKTAGHPDDPDFKKVQSAKKGYANVLSGVSDENVDTDTGLRACMDATNFYPNTARFHLQLGRVFYKKEDFPMALKAFKNASEKGSQPAKVYLGDMYLNGYGVESSDEYAKGYYVQAAKNGYKPALKLMADIGEPVKTYAEDRKEAAAAAKKKEWEAINVDPNREPTEQEMAKAYKRHMSTSSGLYQVKNFHKARCGKDSQDTRGYVCQFTAATNFGLQGQTMPIFGEMMAPMQKQQLQTARFLFKKGTGWFYEPYAY